MGHFGGHFGPIWAILGQFGLSSPLDKGVGHGSNWAKMGQNGPLRFAFLGRFWPFWSFLAKWAKMTNFGHFGQNWPLHLAFLGRIFAHFEPKLGSK